MKSSKFYLVKNKNLKFMSLYFDKISQVRKYMKSKINEEIHVYEIDPFQQTKSGIL